jgi:polyphosphate kinase
MHRNLLSRVEAVAPIEDPQHKERIFDFLNLLIDDHRQGWEMRSDGTYKKRKVKHPKRDLGTHQILMQKARGKPLP